MHLYKKLFSTILFICLAISSFAQTYNQTNSPTDFMNSSGKIYVVVAVVFVILIGLFIYLFYLDRKISKLEKEK